jgi:transcriptional regulator with XRE-family HTH domain
MPTHNGRSTHGAINQMVRESGMTTKEVSLKMGRFGRYLDDVEKRGTNPSASIMAEIAKACGYDMRLVGHGQTIHIRPND